MVPDRPPSKYTITIQKCNYRLSSSQQELPDEKWFVTEKSLQVVLTNKSKKFTLRVLMGAHASVKCFWSRLESACMLTGFTDQPQLVFGCACLAFLLTALVISEIAVYNPAL